MPLMFFEACIARVVWISLFTRWTLQLCQPIDHWSPGDTIIVQRDEAFLAEEGIFHLLLADETLKMFFHGTILWLAHLFQLRHYEAKSYHHGLEQQKEY